MNDMKWRRPRTARALAIFFIGCLFSSLTCGCRSSRAVRETADFLLVNAAVYTLDKAQPWAEAVAIAGGKILYVGKTVGMDAFKAKATRVFDLTGKMVLPGFQDSHIHLVTGGLELGQCNLSGLRTQQEIFARILTYTAAHPEKTWIVGGGWDLPIFPAANPSKEELDRLVPDKPVFLSAADGHSAWVNSRALELAGISAKTPDPANGRIERKATGEPSGTLREAAQSLVGRHIPEPPREEYLNGLREGLALANRSGITSIIEARADEKILETYQALDRAGGLMVRVLASLHVDPKAGSGQISGLVRMRERFVGAHLKSTAAKIFVDGVIESHTAALLELYLDRPGDRGRPLLEPDELDRLATALEKAGFQIHIHAIGDRAVRMSLDALAAARQANGALDLRHHIAHLELIDPADIPRFKALEVVANFQPLWAYPDLYITQLTEPIIGPKRSRWLYPIGSVARTGAVIVGGSDWSGFPLNPLEAIQVAVTRRSIEEPPGAPWIPDECLDLQTAIAAYTINGAFLSHEENIRGSVKTGQAADLIVLDQNLFSISPFDIHRAKVLLTLLEGKVVFQDSSINAGLK